VGVKTAVQAVYTLDYGLGGAVVSAAWGLSC